MLTLEITSIPAASSSATSCQRLALPRARHVGVGELVDERDLGPAGQHRVEVHLLERRAPVGDPGPRDDLQAVDQRGGVLPPVRLHERDDDVGAALHPPVPLAEHGEGLPDARRRAQVDPELAAAVVEPPGGLARLVHGFLVSA